MMVVCDRGAFVWIVSSFYLGPRLAWTPATPLSHSLLASMSTFPRGSRLDAISSSELAKPVLTRPTSDFDAGINSSTAWAEHLGKEFDSLSLSDSDKTLSNSSGGGNVAVAGSIGPCRGRPACVLFDFKGDRTCSELDVRAGDEIEVLKEDLGNADGWSMARIPIKDEEDKRSEEVKDREGEVGFIPRAYYSVKSVLSFRSSMLRYLQVVL